MSTLVSLSKVSKSLGDKELFESLSFGLESNSNVALIGANGAGKTTLLKIIAGEIEPDSGMLSKNNKTEIAYLEQSPILDNEKSILKNILIKSDPNNLEHIQKAKEWFSRLKFEDEKITHESLCKTLSGGWKKKVALIRELMKEPSLVLLDEPTNHLDIESILWLENLINEAHFSVFMITHDRSFLQNTATKIVELNKAFHNGHLMIDGDYEKFCEIKNEFIAGQEQNIQSSSNRLRREIEWMKKSPRARGTKQKARQNQTLALQDEVKNKIKNSMTDSIFFEFVKSENTPKKLIEAASISKSYPDKKLFKELSLLIQKNTKIGILGKNGSGKSTLLRCLLGEEAVDSGEVKRSDHLKVNYYKQEKNLPDSNKNLIEYFSEGDSYKINCCGRWMDARSYLKRFAFDERHFRTQLSKLSGGEKSKLSLAQLMLNDSNLLILDEPSNDLDLESLRALEEALINYTGALILISHDRYLLDQVCTELYAFHPDKNDASLTRFSDIHQWQKWYQQLTSNEPQKKSSAPKTQKENKGSSKKLSYKEKFELENMEPTILAAEKEFEAASENFSKNVSTPDSAHFATLLAEKQDALDTLYARWAELSEKGS